MRGIWFYFILSACVWWFNAAGNSDTTNQKSWEFGSIETCTYSYKESRRERYQAAQKDQLVLWLGAPSRSLMVRGRHGYLPLPTMWASFSHILYFQCKRADDYVVGIHEWMARHPKMSDRDVILAGQEDEKHAFHLLNIAKQLLEKQNHGLYSIPSSHIRLRAIFHHSSTYLPRALFFGQKSFETWNNMNFWTLNRANQSITCNTKLPAVEFFLNDIHLTYRYQEAVSDTSEHVKDNKEMFEYSLSEVKTWGKCFRDLNEFANDYNNRPALTQEMVPPALSPNSHTAFPQCASQDQEQNEMEYILSRNVSIVTYSLIPQAAEIICSFYIGIYISDALYMPPSTSTAAFNIFNSASLQTMPQSWGAGKSGSLESSLGELSPGLYQQAESNHLLDDNHHAPNVGVLFLRSSKNNAENRVELSRLGAIAIFEQLLQQSSSHQANAMDIVELITMDAIDNHDY